MELLEVLELQDCEESRSVGKVVTDCVKGQEAAVVGGMSNPQKMEESNVLECDEFSLVSEVVQEVNL
jgi:hypothetical protein